MRNYKGKRKIAVLGDMLELGKFSVQDHKNVGKMINKFNIDVLIVVGEKALDIKKSSKNISSYRLETSHDAVKIIDTIKPNVDDVILVKGSQGVRMEKIVKALMHNPKRATELLVRQDARWA